jgi:hypothetical protein
MKRTAALGLSLLVAAVLAGPAGATHTLPDPKPGAEPAPCGIHHELAAETIADGPGPSQRTRVYVRSKSCSRGAPSSVPRSQRPVIVLPSSLRSPT